MLLEESVILSPASKARRREGKHDRHGQNPRRIAGKATPKPSWFNSKVSGPARRPRGRTRDFIPEAARALPERRAARAPPCDVAIPLTMTRPAISSAPGPSPMIGAMRWTKERGPDRQTGRGAGTCSAFPGPSPSRHRSASGGNRAARPPTGARCHRPPPIPIPKAAPPRTPPLPPFRPRILPRPTSSPCRPLTADIRRAFAVADAGDAAGAAALLDRNLAAHPGVAGLHAARAGVAMVEDAPEAALGHLADAARLLASPIPPPSPPTRSSRPSPPTPVSDRALPPSRPPPLPHRRPRCPLPSPPAPPAPSRPSPPPTPPGIPPPSVWRPLSPYPPASPAPCSPPGPKTGALDILRELWKRGRAAGNAGDLYDNRDRGHSALKPASLPPARPHRLFAPRRRRPSSTTASRTSSSSTARPSATPRPRSPAGSLWRSLPRLAMTQGDGTGPLRLWQNAEGERSLRLPRPQGLDARPWRPLPGEHSPIFSSAMAPQARISRSSGRWR